MCNRCFQQQYHGFSSYWEYAALHTQLQRLLKSGQLEDIGLRKPPGRYGAEAVLICCSCSEVWWLSSPDNAWRGYFLPAEDAMIYQRKLRRHDLRIRLFAGVLLLAAGIFIYAKCFH